MDSISCEVRMRDTTRAEKLLSLFTSPDNATAIAGDLTEERRHRGSIWFWVHVSTTIVALWRNAVTSAPLANLRLVLMGCAVFATTAFGGTASVSLFPQIVGSPLYWIALSIFWWGAAFWTGMSLVTMAPKHGMVACAMLALIGEALLMTFGVTALWLELLSTEFIIVYTVAVVVAVPLLAGGSVARRRMIVSGPPVLCLLLAVATPASAQQIEWKDPSPHVATMVTVDDQVQLEVLDWGGSGPAIVLLAGLGDTAHVFDDLAPMLTPRHRVLALTRRGHRGSSAAPGGYGFVRLAEDVSRVIDAVGVTNPVVVGHSFAGEEMHVLGARHSAKIRGLVYVDAAFDRGDDADSEAFNAVARAVPSPPGPKADDLASFPALRAYLEKYGGAGPEAYLRTRWIANPDGTVARMWAPDLPIRQAMTAEMRAAYKPYSPERIQVPSVAIYAVPKTANDLIRMGSSDRLPFPELVARAADDPALREQIEKLFVLTRERVRNHEKWFQAFAEGGRVVEIAGPHHLIVSNPRDVLQQIDGFMSSIAATR
jgi:pimeloyl-ACP methyl ester carboxylesterase